MSSEQLIRITSWNVAGKDPLNGGMLNYLFDDSKRVPEINIKPSIQIVGLQEAPQYIFSDPWTSNLSNTLGKKGYILFKRHKLSGIFLYIFVLREIILQCRDFETESVKTGFGGLLGNKGGVTLRFSYNGNSFSATNSHLAAHQENLRQRVQDYNSILEGTKFNIDPNTSNVLTHDYSFWFGDLNFRFDGIEKFEVLDIITKIRTSNSSEERSKAIENLYKFDQLMRVKNKGEAFSEFTENPPKFLPTYKFQIGSNDTYDSENRIPAWTDRVLFRYLPNVYQNATSGMKSQFKPKLEQLLYDSLPETTLSDHKPIVSVFRVATFDPKIFNPSHIPYEVVKFEPITGWKTNEDGRLWYKISNELFYRRPKVLSSWDKLALYKADFSSLEEYLIIVFVNNLAKVEPSLTAQEVPYISSTPSSRNLSPSASRRNSTSSTSSIVVGTEAITLNNLTSAIQTNSQRTIVSDALNQELPDDAIIGDGYKYFSATFPDDVLIPGKYVVLYLKTNSADEYNVYGISNTIDVISG